MPRLVLLSLILMQVLAVAPGTPAASPAPTDGPGSSYLLDVALDDIAGTIGGTLDLDWHNDTGQPQHDLPFRLYPNGAHYGDGGIAIGDVTVGGEPVTPEIAADPTVMIVPLPRAIEPGDGVDVTIAFSTTIPVASSGSYGILQHLPEPGWWALADWYPVVAGWEDDAGWYLDPPTSYGDPTFASATAWHEVTVRHPAGLSLIGGGDELVTTSGEGSVTTFERARLREFAMVALPEGALVDRDITVGAQRVRLKLPRSWAVPGAMDVMETAVRDAMPRYAAWMGALPGDETLDITAADLSGALGVSWDGVVWMDLAPIAADGALDDAEAIGLRLVLIHELGHQWLPALIGTNSNDHTFLTEGLVNTLLVAIVREVDGPDEARAVMGGLVAGPYRAFTNGGQDGVVDRPISDDRPGVIHAFLVYGKAALGFEAIRQAIGDEAFFEALATMSERHTERHFGPEDLLSSFGTDAEALWREWFGEESTSVTDVDAVIAASGD